MNRKECIVLQLIKASIWGTQIDAYIDQDVYTEMKKQAVHALPAPILNSLNICETVLKEWRQNVIKQVSYNIKNRYVQSTLPISVPYAILKGVAAAQYYPCKELRSMGDIDIITGHNDYNRACDMLLHNGYKEIVEHIGKGYERHRCFIKNGVIIEIHLFYTISDDPQKTEYLDNLIINNITPTHILPDDINGLVLLEHMKQHLENGLGLRHIIDWMMFVNNCLPDEKWFEFQEKAKILGLDQLALISTKMCEMYMGLPHRKWCDEVNEDDCNILLDYVMKSGNFGNKWVTAEAISENVIAHANTPQKAFKLLQNRGLINWKASQNHKALRMFAWLYQAIRYFIKGMKRHNPTQRIINEYKAAKKRNEMFHKLNISTTNRGVAIYKDGGYIVKK